MTDRETNIRSVLFLVIGILLLLSLVICIYIVSSESDLVKTQAEILEVKKDIDGTGKNEVRASYEVDGQSYQYTFRCDDDLEVGNFFDVYYHEKNNTSVTTSQTSKLIFVCPLIGLGLCILGIFELFKREDDNESEFNTAVIGVVGNTQQLKIVTTDTPVQEYVKTPEEEIETQVKIIKKENDVVPIIETSSVKVESQDLPAVKEVKNVVQDGKQPDIIKATVSASSTSSSVLLNSLEMTKNEKERKESKETVSASDKKDELKKQETIKESASMVTADDEKIKKEENKNDKVIKSDTNKTQIKNENEENSSIDKVESSEKKDNSAVESNTKVENTEIKKDENPDLPKESVPVEEAVIKKVQENIDKEKVDDKKSDIAEEDIKKVIKDVLKEVIQEVNINNEPAKKVVQRRVLPNYYSISGTSLIYEEPGKETKEISLKTIKSVVRTINSAGSIVKLIVSTDEIKCVLTNMKNIDLEQVANLLHNKMRTIDENFEEVIEHKEY